MQENDCKAVEPIHLENEPDIYFEMTSPNYKESPSRCKKNEGLHPKRLPYVKEVQRMEPAVKGAYFKWNLHKTPHYQQSKERRSEIEDICASNNIPVVAFRGSESYIKENDYAIYNHNTPEFHTCVSSSHSKIEFREILKRVLDTNGPASKVSRGNLSISVGYSQLNQRRTRMREVAVPQVGQTTDSFYVQQMCHMTSLINDVAPSFPSKPPIFGDNPVRTAEFSNYLPSWYGLDCKLNHNLVEAATFAVTKVSTNSDMATFGCHLDQFNDSIPNWNVTVCAFEYIFHEGDLYRVAVIAYSRSAIRHFYRRCNSFLFLRENLIQFIRHVNRSRGSRYSALTILNREYTVFQEPHLNICVYYSAYTSCTRELLQSHPNFCNLPKIAELLLPMVWVTTPVLVYECFKNWTKTKPPKSNLSIAFTKYCISKHGGMLVGDGQRSKTSFKFSFYKHQLVQSLRCLLKALELGRQQETTFEDVYNYLAGKAGPKIYGSGGTGVQTVIAVASLVGVFGHHRFLTEAVISHGTFSAKKLSSLYGIGVKSGNEVITSLAKSTGQTKMTIANGINIYHEQWDPLLVFDPVEYDKQLSERVMDRAQNIHPDTCFRDQSIYYPEVIADNDGNSAIRIEETKLTESGDSEVELAYFFLDVKDINYVDTCKLDFPWWISSWQDYQEDEEIKVSTASKIQDRENLIKRNKNFNDAIGPSSNATSFKATGKKAIVDEHSSMYDLDSDSDDSMADLEDPPFVIHDNKKAKYYSTFLSRRQLRSCSTRALDMMTLEACHEDKTYAGMCVYREMCTIFMKTVGCPSQKKGRRSSTYLRVSYITNDASEKIYTSTFDGGTGLSLSAASEIPFYSRGLCRIHSGIRYYNTDIDAKLAIIVETLVKNACGKWMDRLPNHTSWADRHLPQDKINCIPYYCAFHSSEYFYKPNIPWGLLFFLGERRVLAVPSGETLEVYQMYDIAPLSEKSVQYTRNLSVGITKAVAERDNRIKETVRRKNRRDEREQRRRTKRKNLKRSSK